MQRVPETGAMDNQNEVEEYDSLSKKHLRIVEKLFIKRACELFGKSISDKSIILDVGTGPANIPIKFIQKRPDSRIIAIDLSMNMLKTAKSNISDAGLENSIFLICADMENLKFKDENFHFAFSHSTLHHLENPLPTLLEMIRVIKRKSRFIIRDLRRPPSILLNAYVQVFGFRYSKLMKKMYKESLKAGFTYTDIKRICNMITSSVSKARRFFITHVGIEGEKSPHRGLSLNHSDT